MNPIPMRRVVTGHDSNGRAVVTDDQLFDPKPGANGAAAFTLLWTADGMPVDNDDASDGRERNVGLSLPGGTVLRIVDLMPGKRSAFHRTNTLDYGIVMSGVIDLELDDGVTTRLDVGAVIVQRGTIHAWVNPSADTIARVAFVLIDAKPATVNGVALPERLPGSTPAKA